MTLSPSELKEHTQQLQLRQKQLKEVLDSGQQAAKTVELDQTCVGRLSRMDALQAQAMSKESDQRRRVELKQIALALIRIDDDEFGLCKQCDEPIAKARLSASPTVELCIGCASSREE